jgi:type I restriction enzyme S subunit
MSKIDEMLKGVKVEYKPLGDIADIGNVGVDKKSVVGQKSVRLLNYMDIYRNQYIDAATPTMEVTASDNKIRDCDIRKGDVFITPTSETKEDIGHSAVVIKTVPNAVYSYHIMRIRLHNQAEIMPEYVNYLFRSSSLQVQILRYATGMTRFGLNRRSWAKLRLPIPPLEVQREIVNVLNSFTELEAELEARKKQYEHYRNQLLSFDALTERERERERE